MNAGKGAKRQVAQQQAAAAGSVPGLGQLAAIKHCNLSKSTDQPSTDMILPTRSPSSLAKAWVDALDQIGLPFCLTHIVMKNDKPANITFVHPGGVTAGSTGATRT